MLTKLGLTTQYECYILYLTNVKYEI